MTVTSATSTGTSESVKVIVRYRPLNKREKDLKCKVILEMDSVIGQCSISNPGDPNAPSKVFTFDGAYGFDSTTEQIYNEIVFPIVESVTEGYNGTVFAYGQTGCGKSFTMQGVTSPPTQRGIIPRSFEHIFEAISTTAHTKFLVHASYLEIYNEEIRDLLGHDVKKKLDLKENSESGVYVAGLSMHPIHNVMECEKIMEQGWKNRAVGATLMNADSSRSHSIFTIHLERISTDTSTSESSNIRKGKLNLVDLAGSERQTKTGATGDRLKEATKINLSLSALGNVISALVDGKSKHIPYRDSKLTRLLQDSLGGNTRTLMIACLSPADNNYDETLSTLRYANRAKNIQNKPKVNEDPKDALLRSYQEEIKRLREMISHSPQPPIGESEPNEAQNGKAIAEEETEKIKAEYDQKMSELLTKFEEERESNEKLKSEMDALKSKAAAALSTVTGQPIDPNIIGNTETIERLAALEDFMVGGEKADDPELNEKRAKRKRIAERKINAIKEALRNFDNDDQLLLKAYGDITEELRARTLLLKKAKKKIISLEREVSDLQSEFEQDRTDYLETIRRLEQQVKLFSQILDKIGPCIRRDCNYANIDRIKTECVWDEENEKWRLPDLIVTRTKLPPAPSSASAMSQNHMPSPSMTSLSEDLPTGGMIGGVKNGAMNGHRFDEHDEYHNSPSTASSLSGSEGEGRRSGLDSPDDDGHRDRLFEKLERKHGVGVNGDENIAANYFKSKSRKEALLNNKNSQRHTNNNYLTGSNVSLNNHRISPGNMSSAFHHVSSSPALSKMTNGSKSIRLESLKK